MNVTRAAKKSKFFDDGDVKSSCGYETAKSSELRAGIAECHTELELVCSR